MHTSGDQQRTSHTGRVHAAFALCPGSRELTTAGQQQDYCWFPPTIVIACPPPKPAVLSLACTQAHQHSWVTAHGAQNTTSTPTLSAFQRYHQAKCRCVSSAGGALLCNAVPAEMAEQESMCGRSRSFPPPCVDCCQHACIAATLHTNKAPHKAQFGAQIALLKAFVLLLH
jgi:hypothetical protein